MVEYNGLLEVVEKCDKLTPTEKKVLETIVIKAPLDSGISKSVAGFLGVGKRTVDFHLARTREKLGVHSTTEAVAAYILYYQQNSEY